MFARQIAVMKGQAWNVVETLKTLDHGPLELTRRAKVCVWDDLVEIPVAVPMRATSSEMRRRTEEEFQKGIEEEMDIGASNSSAAAAADLLGMSSPAANLPHSGRFELSDNNAEAAVDETRSMEDSLILSNGNTAASSPTRTARDRPKLPRSAGVGGASFPGPVRSGSSISIYATPQRERRYSYATAVGRRHSHTIAQQLHGHGGYIGGRVGYDDDDVEGDLGYAAAEGMEGNQRKVIVERLEPVKARNPVFTWC